jgi:excisionase family DNA binding protein
MPEKEAVVGEEGQWYSIPEAAQYLGISVPTIFRWMRDGLLSFYKVGNSTRFTREGLDAVIEKTTGRKEAEAAVGRCPVCGHSVLIPGRLQSASKVYFHPQKTKFWTFRESLVNVEARVCAACGHVQLRADVDKLTKLTGQIEETREAVEPEAPFSTPASVPFVRPSRVRRGARKVLDEA